jgi:hypothetical protein
MKKTTMLGVVKVIGKINLGLFAPRIVATKKIVDRFRIAKKEEKITIQDEVWRTMINEMANFCDGEEIA